MSVVCYKMVSPRPLGLAVARGSTEMEYTDVHGVCDIAHTEGLIQALSTEMVLNPLRPDANVLEGVELLELRDINQHRLDNGQAE